MLCNEANIEPALMTPPSPACHAAAYDPAATPADPNPMHPITSGVATMTVVIPTPTPVPINIAFLSCIVNRDAINTTGNAQKTEKRNQNWFS